MQGWQVRVHVGNYGFMRTESSVRRRRQCDTRPSRMSSFGRENAEEVMRASSEADGGEQGAKVEHRHAKTMGVA